MKIIRKKKLSSANLIRWVLIMGPYFVYFAEKSVTSSLRQVRPVIFRSTKFVKAY